MARRHGHKREVAPGLWELSAYLRTSDRRVYKRFRGTAYQADRALSELVRQAREGETGTGRQTLATYLQATWLPSPLVGRMLEMAVFNRRIANRELGKLRALAEREHG